MKSVFATSLKTVLVHVFFLSAALVLMQCGENAESRTAQQGIKLRPLNSVRDYRSFQSPVKSQVDRGTCTAFAVAGALEVIPGMPADISEKYLYGIMKMKDYLSAGDIIKGDFISRYGPALEQYGVIEEAELPYNGNYTEWYSYESKFHKVMLEGDEGPVSLLVKYVPKAKVFLAPNKYINYGIEQARDTSLIKKLLRDQGIKAIPVSYSNIYKYGWSEGTMDHPIQADKGHAVRMMDGSFLPYSQVKRNFPDLHLRIANDPGIMVNTDANSKLYGGHAVNIVGYNDDGFIIKNSWGTDWGTEGYAVISYDYHMMKASEMCLFYEFIKK